MLGVVARRRDRLEDRLEQRLEIRRELVRREPGPSRARVRVDDRELDLRVVGVEVEEELVHLVHDLRRPRVGAVDLVDDEDDRKLQLERLAQHEPRLRQRPLGRVDEQQHAVHHRQRALDLAAEVGVARRVDDVDLRLAVLHRRVLGEDRDPLLALEVHRVHDPLVDVLVLAEGAGLPEHRVDERRLAVVDVRDDRDVAEVVAGGAHIPQIAKRLCEDRQGCYVVARTAPAVPGDSGSRSSKDSSSWFSNPAVKGVEHHMSESFRPARRECGSRARA